MTDTEFLLGNHIKEKKAMRRASKILRDILVDREFNDMYPVILDDVGNIDKIIFADKVCISEKSWPSIRKIKFYHKCFCRELNMIKKEKVDISYEDLYVKTQILKNSYKIEVAQVRKTGALSKILTMLRYRHEISINR